LAASWDRRSLRQWPLSGKFHGDTDRQRTVLRVNPVRRSISDSDRPSRKYMRRNTAEGLLATAALLKRADERLLRAKRGGRAQVLAGDSAPNGQP
jgi:hypothetical protein